jgi:hypothetical protein
MLIENVQIREQLFSVGTGHRNIEHLTLEKAPIVE